MAPKILKSTLFIVNCSDCLSAEFVGHASIPYNKIGGEGGREVVFANAIYNAIYPSASH